MPPFPCFLFQISRCLDWEESVCVEEVMLCCSEAECFGLGENPSFLETHLEAAERLDPKDLAEDPDPDGGPLLGKPLGRNPLPMMARRCSFMDPLLSPG